MIKLEGQLAKNIKMERLFTSNAKVKTNGEDQI